MNFYKSKNQSSELDSRKTHSRQNSNEIIKDGSVKTELLKPNSRESSPSFKKKLSLRLKKSSEQVGNENAKSNIIYNTIILGGGCAGLSASTWIGRSSVSHLVFTAGKCDMSSMISTTSIVENFPGFKSIEGKELIEKFRKQAETYGAKIIEKCVSRVVFPKQNDSIIGSEKDVKPIFKVYDHENREYSAFSIIIATGSVPNKLNIENEDKLWGKYISSCAVCDGSRFKNKRIIVLGGGDSALEEALTLSKFSNKITLIHRRNTFRASTVMQDKVAKNSRIKVLTDHVVEKINIFSLKIGVQEETKLDSLICKNVKTGKILEIKADAMFYALGFKPNSNLFEGILELDERKYIVRKDCDRFENCTSIPGVFVCGDVSNKRYKNAISSSADGVQAALDVNDYLRDIQIIQDEEF